MMHTLITIVLVVIAYRLGYQQGWKRYETTVMNVLNRMALRRRVPKDDRFCSDNHREN
ncbi:MAG TPA: hypothetical protein V6C65_24285 [Allocoleopsis sp.]